MSVSAAKKFENFSSWFDDLLLKARIVDNRFPVKGFLAYMENGAFMLDKIKELFEEELEKIGHKKRHFPLVTSEELFGGEAEHIKGFSKEVFVIDQETSRVEKLYKCKSPMRENFPRLRGLLLILPHLPSEARS